MNDKNKTGLYSIKNKVNGKVYYGSTNNFQKRWKKHKRDLRKNEHHNDHLQRSWNRYGEEAFEFSIFAYCVKELLFEYEQILLDLYVGEETCYNASPMAGGGSKKGRPSPFRGKKHSEETKRKISQRSMGAGNPNYGKKASAETRAKLSKIRKGKPKPTRTCPHCGKVGSANNMSRWHFDKCKHKGE